MRWLRVGFLPVSMMILVAAAFLVPLPAYVEQPGRVVPLAACTAVDDPRSTPVNGDYLLTTINVLQATVADAVTAAFDGDASLTPRRDVIPPGLDAGVYFHEQRQLFQSTAQIAAAVGLDAAGKPASVSGDGALLLHVAPGSPAAESLAQGDVIVRVDGRPIGTEVELRHVIQSTPAGEPLTIEVQREGRTVTVEVAATEVEGTPQIGVVPQTLNQRVTLPLEVDVLSGPIGGPSAGLMVALAVYDKVLPDVDLAAGRVVAGTGTIDATGRVGTISGVGHKVIAAHRRGAEVFFAPVATVEAARAALPDGSQLQIVPVESFNDARRALLDVAPAPAAESPQPQRECPYASQS
ncbi:MAG: PDZ domain-containing protein [Nitriliruptorales bacterium]|nr:PDZ domain-containing protein [Nitriliruptorales bacterium]